MAKASDNVFPKVILGVGTAPAAPSDSSWRLYSQANGIYARSSNSVVGPFSTGAGGGIASDTIWDAAGDLAVGTGADTAARLAKGAAGTVPTAGASTLAYAYPPGYELDYVEFTANVGCTATTAATANTIVTANAVSFDGSTIAIVEFYCENAATQATANVSFIMNLWDGSTDLGNIATVRTPAAAVASAPVLARRRLTPSNASHTFSVRGWTTSGTSTAVAGAGGAGTAMPGYIRIILK